MGNTAQDLPLQASGTLNMSKETCMYEKSLVHVYTKSDLYMERDTHATTCRSPYLCRSLSIYVYFMYKLE